MSTFLLNNVQKTICSCRTHIDSLDVCQEKASKAAWIEEFCALVTEALENIKGFGHDGEFSSLILLYLSQTLTLTKFIAMVFDMEETTSQTINTAREFARQHLLTCLERIETAIAGKHGYSAGVTTDGASSASVSFLDLMDESIAMLSSIITIDPKEDKRDVGIACSETRMCVEDTLSHAMSIAQVCPSEEIKVIMGSCQTVLEVLNCLIQEASKDEPNSSMMKLFADNCIGKLEALERKVNLSVLRLCLSCFSNFARPLEEIENFCLNSDERSRENSTELDNMIAEFDLHVDRLIQIGLFAASCTKEDIRKIQLKNSLASLEALETEIVPAFLSAMRHHKRTLDSAANTSSCSYASLLKQHWTNEVNQLRNMIYFIVEPHAFLQVIYEESSRTVNDLSQKFKREEKCLGTSDIEPILDIVAVLKEFLIVADPEFSDKEKRMVNSISKDLSKMAEELHSASKTLLSNKDDSNNHDDGSNHRILKRCKILLNCIKRLCHGFAETAEVTTEIDNGDSKPSDGQTIRDNQLDAEETIATHKSSDISPSMNQILAKGKSIMEERSLLYRTPHRIDKNTIVSGKFCDMIKTN